MRAIIDNAYHAFNQMPVWLAAVLIGWAISAGFTQTIKFWMPLVVAERIRETIARSSAIGVAALASGLVMADREGTPAEIALVALATGLWSPLAFMMLQAVLRRWWPFAADVLSADVRNSVFGKKNDDHP